MTDIPRAQLVEMRDSLVQQREAHKANFNAADGAIQALDRLLAPVAAPAPVNANKRQRRK